MPLRWPAPTALAATLLACALAYILRRALDDLFPPGFPFVTFFPVVIGTAFFLGSRMGGIAAIICGFASWYFFVPPVDHFGLDAGSLMAMGFYSVICAVDITLIHFMQTANRSLRHERETSARLAETRELLFRELQHRISNNLQMVAALLTVQRRQVSDPSAKAALDEASSRLATIGRISRQLYDPDGAGRELAPFLDEIARDIVQSSGRSGIAHRISGDYDRPLHPEAAVPLALVVAESIANAIEHAFDGRDQGQLDIRIVPHGDSHLSVEIEDDGHGLPDGFTIDQADSLGLRIATMLAGQLGGRFTLSASPSGHGTLARLDLPHAA